MADKLLDVAVKHGPGMTLTWLGISMLVGEFYRGHSLNGWTTIAVACVFVGVVVDQGQAELRRLRRILDRQTEERKSREENHS